jgi:hypothetical protein
MIGKTFFAIMVMLYNMNTSQLEISPTYQVEWIKYSCNDTMYTVNFQFGIVESVDTLTNNKQNVWLQK